MPDEEPAICSPKQLPPAQQIVAAQSATEINPVNAPIVLGPAEPHRIAVMTSKYWGRSRRRFATTFMEKTSVDLRRRIFTHLNAWYSAGAGIKFYYSTAPDSEIRIAFEPDGYWSYLGTDVTQIPLDQQTMNLQGFTMNTSEREFRRVVAHEAGHTLGFPHEHMRREVVAKINKEAAYNYFGRTQGWSRRDVDQQVLTALEDSQLITGPTDTASIMCYQLPGSIMVDGQPVTGGADLTDLDKEFARRVYP